MKEYKELIKHEKPHKCEEYKVPIPALVPGEVHVDLKRAGILDKDVLWRTSEIDNYWVTLQ
jgi:NADPH:quinone reductase-like Zn-dependent oxidoreductase